MRSAQPECDSDIECSHRCGTDGQAILSVVDKLRLQRKRDDRRAENNRAVDKTTKIGWLPESKENGDGLIEQEKENQEGFSTAE